MSIIPTPKRFRRKDCPEDTLQLHLHGIDADADYAVEVTGERTVAMHGAQLAAWNIVLDAPRTCRWVFYRKLK